MARAAKAAKNVPVPAKPAKRLRRRRQPVGEISLWPGFISAVLVGLVYSSVATQGTFRFKQSMFPHHVLVADAWLHGQLHVRNELIEARNERFYRNYRASLQRRLAARGRRLTEQGWRRVRARLTPPSAHDWSIVDGKHYGYWGPMVPALLLPYVAVAGPQASDMLFSCLVGMGSVLLTFLMLRQAGQVVLIPVTTSVCVALALLLGLGTVHFFLAVAGQVWFLSQIVATFFMTMAVWFIFRSEEGIAWTIAAGGAFGASFLARSSILVTVPFFYCTMLALWRRSPEHQRRQLIRQALGFSLPLILAGFVALAYNYARFGDPFESGARIQLLTGANPRFKRDYLQYGLFSFHYLPRNCYYYFVNPMLRRYPSTQAITFDPWGNSMFLVTPALLYVFRSFHRCDWLAIGAWSGAGSSLMLLLLFMGSGWYGFGNRYLLDLMPLAILLIAIGMKGRLSRASILLICLSIVVNAWGTYRFCAEQF